MGIAIGIAAVDGHAVVCRRIAASGKSRINAGRLIGSGGIGECAVIYDNAVAGRRAGIRIAAVKPVGEAALGAAYRICPAVDDQLVVGGVSFLGVSRVECVAVVLVREVLVQRPGETRDITLVCGIAEAVDILGLGDSTASQPAAYGKDQYLFVVCRANRILFNMAFPLIFVL